MNSNRPVKIAIQEDMLPGPTLEDRFHQAADLGLQGIEFWSQTLPEQANSIEQLSGTGGIVAASINNGQRSRFLDPNLDERKRALSELKEAMTLAGRIGASGVVFVPHFFEPLLPDLSPWMDSISVERGLLTAQLEELADHAQAESVQLWVEPVNRYETHLLNRLQDAASLISGLSHPNLGIVADFFHMALEEPDILAALLRFQPVSFKTAFISLPSASRTALFLTSLRGGKVLFSSGSTASALASFGRPEILLVSLPSNSSLRVSQSPSSINRPTTFLSSLTLPGQG